MTYGFVSVLKGGRLIQVEKTKKDKHNRTTTAWPRPLNRGWPLNTRNKYSVCMSEKSGL